MEILWKEARQADTLYKQMIESIREGKRIFPAALGLKVSISEYSLSVAEYLKFRERFWVSDLEKLRIKIIQDIHDSKVYGYPGQDNIRVTVTCQFFWPKMYKEVRRFV